MAEKINNLEINLSQDLPLNTYKLYDIIFY